MAEMISIVLPVYNCGAGLPAGLAALKQVLDEQHVPYELIIVDDGSDNQAAVEDIAIKNNCLLIKHSKNAGKGAAVKHGILQAGGAIIIFMDGDFPFHLSVIGHMIEKLRTPGVEVVIGDRTLKGSTYPANIEASRKLGSRILSGIISRLYVFGIRDTQCGIKGFKKEAGKNIFEKVTRRGFSFDVEVLFIARKNGYAIHRIPVQVYEQASSSVRVMRDGLAMLQSLFAIFINNISGKYRIDE
jgi:dolichyl-phosphate beta-glucosyltransferase